MRQAALERDVIRSVDAIRSAAGSAYSGFGIEHSPRFRVSVFVARDVDEQAVRNAVPTDLRQFIAIRKVSLTETETRALVDEAAQNLRRQGVDFAVGYNLENDGLDVAVDARANADEVRALLPERARTRASINRGLRERPTVYTRPSGVVSGDATYGGWELYPISSGGEGKICTAAITGRDSYGDNIVITAGHCVLDLGVTYTIRTPTQGRELALPTENFRIPSQDSRYDVAHVNMYGLAAEGGWMWVKNGIDPYDEEYRLLRYRSGRFIDGVPNTVAGWSTGYMGILGTIRQSSIGLGTTLCKAGALTGMTCGKVTNVYLSTSTRTGFIEVGQSTQRYIVAGGDSGGPVFTPPDVNGQALVAGIESTSVSYGYSGSGECIAPYDCRFAAMPIERADDIAPVTVYSSGGAFAP